MKLNFKIDEEKELISVLTNPIDEKSDKIIKQLQETHRVFIEKYSHTINNIAFDTSIYDEFDYDLLTSDVVPRKSVVDVKTP